MILVTGATETNGYSVRFDVAGVGTAAWLATDDFQQFHELGSSPISCRASRPRFCGTGSLVVVVVQPRSPGWS